jgi:hypothetical protein
MVRLLVTDRAHSPAIAKTVEISRGRVHGHCQHSTRQCRHLLAHSVKGV